MIKLNTGFNEKHQKFMGYSAGVASSSQTEGAGVSKHEIKKTDEENAARRAMIAKIGSTVGESIQDKIDAKVGARKKEHESYLTDTVGIGNQKISIGDEDINIWGELGKGGPFGGSRGYLEYSPELQEALKTVEGKQAWSKYIGPGGKGEASYQDLVSKGYVHGAQAYSSGSNVPLHSEVQKTDDPGKAKFFQKPLYKRALRAGINLDDFTEDKAIREELKNMVSAGTHTWFGAEK